MTVVENLAASAITVILCVFLLYSHFVFPKPTVRTYAVILAGCYAAAVAAGFLTDPFPMPAVAAVLMGWLLCRFVGQASSVTALLFGMAFGGLRLAALGVAQFLAGTFPGDVSCVLLMEITVLYALVVCASALSEKWRAVPMPVLQLLLVWLMAVLLCEEVIRCAHLNGSVLRIIAFIWLVYAALLLVQTGSRMHKQHQKQQEKQQKIRHYALQEEYYQNLREKQNETRALWHDLNKYLRAAKAEAAPTQALQQLEAMLTSATQVVDVGNQVLNVILNEYAQTARAAGAELQLTVQVPEKLPVSTADLYVLIGNTMDNAIEACSALPPDQRVIHLLLRTHNDVLFYRLANPCTPDRPLRSDTHMHGYGLPNVRSCVKSYGGNVDIREENGFFVISAHLNMDAHAR